MGYKRNKKGTIGYIKDQKKIYMYFIKSSSVKKNNTTGLRTASCRLKENKFANQQEPGGLC